MVGLRCAHEPCRANTGDVDVSQNIRTCFFFSSALASALTLLVACEKPLEPSQRPTVALGVRVLAPNDVSLPKDWSLKHWVLTISAVELHQCVESEWSMIPAAHAHVPSSSTRLGTPAAEDLTRGTGGARIIGEISPPPGRYCKAYAILSPADDDLLNMTALPTSALEGNTSVRVLEHPDKEELVVETWQGRVAVPVDLVSPQNPNGLELGPSGHAQILFEISPDLSEIAVDEVAESGDNLPALETWIERMIKEIRLYTP